MALGSETLVDDFPPVETALSDPDGLLAAGGDLDTQRILSAYRRGIFPWYNDKTPILWWSPDPRCVMFPDAMRVTQSLQKTIRSGRFDISMDRDFAAVIDGCAAPRKGSDGTWINSDIRRAYIDLHRAGHAHSVECRQDGELAGGLYGVSIGRVFFGESMFAKTTDASKVALYHLLNAVRDWDYEMVDCQVRSKHLESLGAITMPRRTFIERLDQWCELPSSEPGSWASAGGLHE